MIQPYNVHIIILNSFKAMRNVGHHMVLRQQTEASEASNLHGSEVNYCHRET